MSLLALSAHPDDVEYGCGGTVAAAAAAGEFVALFVASDGACGADPAIRRDEQKRAADRMGVKALLWGEQPDTRADLHDLIERLNGWLRKLNPDRVLVNAPADSHQDHRTLAMAALAAARHVPTVLLYETPTSTSFRPAVFRDVAATFPAKLEALAQHVSQAGKTPTPGLGIVELATATATFRGTQARTRLAEAFEPIRVRW